MSKAALAVEYLMSRPWALDSATLDLMHKFASRNRGVDALEAFLNPDGVYETLEAKGGGKYGDTMTVRAGGVAVLPVHGVISRYANMFNAICGGTSTQILSRDFNMALNDPGVRSIALWIDSGGGDANGINEFANMVYQARGKKKIVAYIGGSGCSAAYWIASAADEVVMDATAQVGSIGTVLNMRLRKPKDDDEYEELEIVSSQSPKKRLDPRSKEGKEEYQSRLDELSDVFIDCVARNMNVSRETVLNDFGEGGVYMGKVAVEKGMATRLGSLEGVISELAKGNYTVSSNNTNAAESGETVSFSWPTAETMATGDFVTSLTEHRPDVIAAINGPAPVMAIDAASDIASAAKAAGVSEMVASLLTGDMTKAAAEIQIKNASEMKNKLAAAGLSGSFSALFESIGDPAALVGKAIHEARASGDESSDLSNVVTGQSDNVEASINVDDIYAKRNSGK